MGLGSGRQPVRRSDTDQAAPAPTVALPAAASGGAGTHHSTRTARAGTRFGAQGHLAAVRCRWRSMCLTSAYQQRSATSCRTHQVQHRPATGASMATPAALNSAMSVRQQPRCKSLYAQDAWTVGAGLEDRARRSRYETVERAMRRLHGHQPASAALLSRFAQRAPTCRRRRRCPGRWAANDWVLKSFGRPRGAHADGESELYQGGVHATGVLTVVNDPRPAAREIVDRRAVGSRRELPQLRPAVPDGVLRNGAPTRCTRRRNVLVGTHERSRNITECRTGSRTQGH